jgi:hypothetical protein
MDVKFMFIPYLHLSPCMGPAKPNSSAIGKVTNHAESAPASDLDMALHLILELLVS